MATVEEQQLQAKVRELELAVGELNVELRQERNRTKAAQNAATEYRIEASTNEAQVAALDAQLEATRHEVVAAHAAAEERVGWAVKAAQQAIADNDAAALPAPRFQVGDVLGHGVLVVAGPDEWRVEGNGRIVSATSEAQLLAKLAGKSLGPDVAGAQEQWQAEVHARHAARRVKPTGYPSASERVAAAQEEQERVDQADALKRMQAAAGEEN
jgi:hypothetical protein